MTTRKLGTTADDSIPYTMVYVSGLDSDWAADFATIAQAILDRDNPSAPIVPGAWSQNGLLFVPNRGVLRVQPGDYVAVDNRGWPILVSADSIANGLWVVT